MGGLLVRFLDEEGMAARRIVVHALKERTTGSEEIQFNVFDIEFDTDARTVTIHDVLEPNSEVLSIDDFLLAVRRRDPSVS